MNQRLILTCLLILAAGADVALAQGQRKMPLSRYAKLWMDSPLTEKPQVVTNEENPFQNYALAGVAPVQGGYMVTLLNKKKPEEKLTLLPNQGKFRVLDVSYDAQRAHGVVVKLTNGIKDGTVTYDDKLLTLKAVQPRPQAMGQPPPGLPNNNQPRLPQQAPGAQPSLPPSNPGNSPPAQPSLPQRQRVH